MKHNTSLWLVNLAKRTHTNMETAKQWLLLSDETLQQRPAAGKWNALECLEHLNRYGDFYLPEFRERIEATIFRTSDEWFIQGWLGGYFTVSMEVKPKLNKMTTFKKMNPVGEELSRNVISKFIHQQEVLLNIINMARQIDINKTRTSISIASFITLKLGDTLAFFTAHNVRHIEQAKHALAQTVSFLDREIAP